MQILVHVMEIILLALIGCLIYSLFRVYRNDQTEGHLEVTVSPSRVDECDSESMVESIKQLQTFWSTQMIEMRLKGIQPHMLDHPNICRQVMDYVFGAANAVADHYHCNQDQRLHLRDFLIEKGAIFKSADVYQLWSDELMTDTGSELYTSGYTAAKDWVNQKSLPKSFSLYSSIIRWGLIT